VIWHGLYFVEDDKHAKNVIDNRGANIFDRCDFFRLRLGGSFVVLLNWRASRFDAKDFTQRLAV